MSLSIPTHLSFVKTLTSQSPNFLRLPPPAVTLLPRRTTVIRMGGGPRTYPGGVSKWQWKRMQAKKAKQLLKARLCRERQIYEMRKRAELKAAVTELERPWEPVERAPNMFSVRADEQLKVLADRFQKAGGFDLWSERDGPQLFETPEGVPSARFFPKGVVHSIKPYGKIEGRGEAEGWGGGGGDSDEVDEIGGGNESDAGKSKGKWRKRASGRRRFGSDSSALGTRRSFAKRDTGVSGSGALMLNAGGGFSRSSKGDANRSGRSRGSRKFESEEAYDMSLQPDGSYEFEANGIRKFESDGSHRWEGFELD